jgi:hypothetical protein
VEVVGREVGLYYFRDENDSLCVVAESVCVVILYDEWLLISQLMKLLCYFRYCLRTIERIVQRRMGALFFCLHEAFI